MVSLQRVDLFFNLLYFINSESTAGKTESALYDSFGTIFEGRLKFSNRNGGSWPNIFILPSQALWEDLYMVSVIDPEPREIMRRQMKEIRDEQVDAKQRVVKLRRWGFV